MFQDTWYEFRVLAVMQDLISEPSNVAGVSSTGKGWLLLLSPAVGASLLLQVPKLVLGSSVLAYASDGWFCAFARDAGAVSWADGHTVRIGVLDTLLAPCHLLMQTDQQHSERARTNRPI